MAGISVVNGRNSLNLNRIYRLVSLVRTRGAVTCRAQGKPSGLPFAPLTITSPLTEGGSDVCIRMCPFGRGVGDPRLTGFYYHHSKEQR